MARTRASRSSGAGAPQKKSSSSGSASRASGPKVLARAAGGGSASPAKRGYGPSNHAQKCATPQWQRSISAAMPGLALNPNCKPPAARELNVEATSSADDRDVVSADEQQQPSAKKTTSTPKRKRKSDKEAKANDDEGEIGTNQKKKQKIRKTKESNKKKVRGEEKGPKRARSAYIYFTSDKRAEVKAQNPELKFGDVTKKLAEAWKALSPEDKQKYEEMARQDRERFDDEKNGNTTSTPRDAEDEAEEAEAEAEKLDLSAGVVVLDDMGEDNDDGEGDDEGEQEVVEVTRETPKKKRRVVLEEDELSEDF